MAAKCFFLFVIIIQIYRFSSILHSDNLDAIKATKGVKVPYGIDTPEQLQSSKTENKKGSIKGIKDSICNKEREEQSTSQHLENNSKESSDTLSRKSKVKSYASLQSAVLEKKIADSNLVPTSIKDIASLNSARDSKLATDSSNSTIQRITGFGIDVEQYGELYWLSSPNFPGYPPKTYS